MLTTYEIQLAEALGRATVLCDEPTLIRDTAERLFGGNYSCRLEFEKVAEKAQWAERKLRVLV